MGRKTKKDVSRRNEPKHLLKTQDIAFDNAPKRTQNELVLSAKRADQSEKTARNTGFAPFERLRG
jgi:hypothetical protein